MNASKESKLLSKLKAKKAEAKHATTQRKRAEKARREAASKREHVMASGEKKAHLAKVIRDDMGVPRSKDLSTKLTEAEKKQEADLKTLQKEIGAALANTQKAIDDEAAAFEKKQRAKATAEERRKREEVRRRVAEEEAEAKAEAKRARAEMTAQLKDKMARKEAFDTRKKELAAMERRQLVAAKEHQEEFVRRSLSEWEKNKKETFSKDLARRQREELEEAAEIKKKLKEAQRDWQSQEAVRLAVESAMAKKRQDDTANFHAHLRQKYVEEEIIRYEHKLDAEKREAEKAMKDAAYAAEAAEREAAIAREKAERFVSVKGDAAAAQFSFKLW